MSLIKKKFCYWKIPAAAAFYLAIKSLLIHFETLKVTSNCANVLCLQWPSFLKWVDEPLNVGRKNSWNKTRISKFGIEFKWLFTHSLYRKEIVLDWSEHNFIQQVRILKLKVHFWEIKKGRTRSMERPFRLLQKGQDFHTFSL